MPVLIKRYANRKLYNTEASRYITLKGISELVREGREIEVIDNETGKDITPIILSQILVDDQKQAADDGTAQGAVLSELIQKGGDAIYAVLRRSMGDVSENLNEVRDNVRRWMQPGADGSEELSHTVYESVEKALRVVDLPTRADIEALNKNVERLASALEGFITSLDHSSRERPS